jgi:hypothetical protein
MLRLFKIRSRSIWISGKTAKGYTWEQFEAAWGGYSPPDDRPAGSSKIKYLDRE